MQAKINLTAVFEKAEEGGYVAYIEEIPGVNTQGETLEEARENLLDALELIMELRRELAEKKAKNSAIIIEPIQIAS